MPRAATVTAPCSVCETNLQVRTDGNIRIHGPVHSRCPGSERPPACSQPPSTPPSNTSINTSITTSGKDSNILYPGRVNIKIVPRIPRSARDLAARKLADILDDICVNNSPAAWERLFLFARRCLCAPARGGRRRNLATYIHKTVSEEKEIDPSCHQTFKPPKDPLKNLAARVASKLEEGDFRGAVRIASSNESFAPVNDSTLTLLKEKHPPPHPYSEVLPQPINSVPLEISTPTILSAIQSFPAGSAAGPDGLRPQHLKDLLSGKSGLGSNLLSQALTRFVNFVLKGEIREDARPFFFGASLVALSKPGGGVRPIAVGYTLRRLVAKCASLPIREAMGNLLSPLQLGYGTPGGVEAAVHAARIYLQNMPPNNLMLKIDFKNAFNTIRRDKMLHSVLEFIPEIYPLVHSAYCSPTHLFFGNHIVSSAEGVQQGDPLGPLLFSITIHRLLGTLHSEFRIFYLDDGTLGGPLDEVLDDLRRFEDAAEDIGLFLNHRKSEVICSDADIIDSILSISPEFTCVNPSEACLLGSPIGDLQSINKVLNSKHSTLILMGERLTLLHSQDALCLLRNAFSLPKILYILRTAPCFLSTILKDLDNLQRSLLEDICNVELTSEAWSQASLPIKSGGLGIRSFVVLAPSAYLASAAGNSCISYKILPESLCNAAIPHVKEALVVWSKGHSADAPSGQDSHRQKAWDSPRVKAVMESLLSQATPETKGRLLAAQRKESGAWLSAPPVSSLGMRIEDEVVRIAVGLRLGTPLCTTHRCNLCGNQVDTSGTHGLHCRKKPGVHSRHATLNNIIQRSLAAADIPSVLEPVGLCRSDGKRADGVTIIPWKRGRALAWDVTCWDTFAPSYTSHSSSGAGTVANLAEARKMAIYSNLNQTHHFVPIGFETTGVFGDGAMSFLKELGHLIKDKSSDPQSFHHLCQRLSMTIQKFNAEAILSCSSNTNIN